MTADPSTWQPGEIHDVLISPLALHQDERGWLAELFRSDDLPGPLAPAMAYVSVTRPGAARGPHEHLEQTDLFGFLGPGSFRVSMWDPRPESPTCGTVQILDVGAGCPTVIAVPPRIVHGYRNVSDIDAWVINMPNRLYRGAGRQDEVDEVRHEDDGESPYGL